MKQECKAQQFLLRARQHFASSVEAFTVKKREEGARTLPLIREYSLSSLPTSEPQALDGQSALYFQDLHLSASPCSSVSVSSIYKYYKEQYFVLKPGPPELSWIVHDT
jgi:hypothetical protein